MTPGEPAQGQQITYGVSPEDEILSIVQTKGQVFLTDLPKRLRRTSRWTRDLEMRGLIRRVVVLKNGGQRLLLVAAGASA